MHNGATTNCFYNPRYSDCLKEMLLQSLLADDENQRLFDRHGCQGPIQDDNCQCSIIDSSQLMAMRSGWDAGAGPYPAYRVQQRAGPLITQKNLLTVMRARRLGPLRVRAAPTTAAAEPVPPLQPPVPTPRSIIDEQTPAIDSCLSYRDHKDRQRFAVANSRTLRRSLPILPIPLNSGSLIGEIERNSHPDKPIKTPKESATASGNLHSSVSATVDILEPDELSLSFNYNRFRERLSRWEAAAEAAVVASSPVSSSELRRMQRRPAASPGLQIRSVVVSDQSAAAPIASTSASRSNGGSGGVGIGTKSRQMKQVKSNQRR